MISRRFIVLCVFLGVIVAGWFCWRGFSSRQGPSGTPGPTIEKQPEVFASRTFDPDAPPADMPRLGPGEEAVCDSNFLSNASVAGEVERTDATHAIVTITHVKVTLQLSVTIWVPVNASQHVTDHEEGHRQISEYYYQTADKVAEQVAAAYIGKRDLITGSDLNAELTKFLQQTGAEITDEYDKELNPEPAQLRYDTITDHSRNEVVSTDAVAQALKDAANTSPSPGG